MQTILLVIGAVAVVVIALSAALYHRAYSIGNLMLGYRQPKNKAETSWYYWLNQEGFNRRLQRDIAVQFLSDIGMTDILIGNHLMYCFDKARRDCEPLGRALAKTLEAKIAWDKLEKTAAMLINQYAFKGIQQELIGLDVDPLAAAVRQSA